MTHKAAIVKGSVKNLGANGIAFSIQCCGDPTTLERHTIGHAHTVSPMELQDIIERQYLKPCQDAHAATETNTEHLRLMAEGDVTECPNCQ